MEKKNLKKLVLKKEIVSSLSPTEMNNVQGGWTTSFGDCTYFICCNTIEKSCAQETTCTDYCDLTLVESECGPCPTFVHSECQCQPSADCL